MEQKFKKHLDSLLTHFPNPKILVAVSGGVDSVVLAHLVATCGFSFGIAHVNYKLRAENSDLDEELVAKLASELNVSCHSATRPIDSNESGIQEKARDFRYAWFEELMKTHTYNVVVTAHHANDQLETFFMRLSRGSGIEGLCGIKSISTNLVRPLLPFFKQEIIEYAQAHDLQWREDTSNTSTKYLRNAIRHHVMPAFLGLSQHTASNTLTSMHHLTDAFQAISTEVKHIRDGWKNKSDSLIIPLRSLEKLEPQPFWLHHLFSTYGFDAIEIQKLLCTHSGKKCESATHQLFREREHLLLKPIDGHNDVVEEQYSVSKNGIQHPIQMEVSTAFSDIKSTESCVFFDAAKLTFPLTLRKWKRGDVFYPTGMKGKKKLSKYFKDEKMSFSEKEQQWLLCNKNDVIWVVGKRIDRRFVSKDKLPSLQIKLI